MINLYWWNDEPNIGDEASYYVVSKLFGPTKWVNPRVSLKKEIHLYFSSIVHGKHYNKKRLKGYCFPWQRAIMSIGSILDYSTYKTLVWGSGFREPTSKFNGGKVFAVRGKLTLDKIPDAAKNGNIALGDPALLLPLIYKPKTKQRYKLSIIPHFSEFNYFNRTYSNLYNVIDVRTKDVESVIDKIVSSRFVLSSSLHGIIIAHAYNVPAIWIKHGWIKSSDFKFHDYFSGVGIKQYDPFSEKEILDNIENIDDFFDQNKDIILPNDLKPIQTALIDCFPIKRQYEGNIL